MAAAASHFANPTFGGWDRARGRRFVAYELVLSGTGARATQGRLRGDVVGVQRLQHPGRGAGGARSRSSSSASSSSATRRAPGTFRGGCGIRRDLRFLADEGKLTNLSERQRFAPYGLFGGAAGRARAAP